MEGLCSQRSAETKLPPADDNKKSDEMSDRLLGERVLCAALEQGGSDNTKARYQSCGHMPRR